MTANENQIVVYQPNGVRKIDVSFDGETVWLLQPQIAELFSCSLENVRLHLKNIYACGELDKAATSKESLEVRKEGNREVKRKFLYYNLDAIISIGYRVNSIVGVRFRQWATQLIKERMFAGAALAAQFDVIDRRLIAHEKDIVELKNKVDFFVQTQTPPLQGVFFDGQLWDARALVLAVGYNETFHDRFLIVDDKELYLIGASLKDLGKKCFGFTKMDAGAIRGIEKSAFAAM